MSSRSQNNNKNQKKHQCDQEEQEQHQQQHQQQEKNSNSGETISNNDNNATELTAEWSVHAQLTISRLNVNNNRPDGDKIYKPIKIVYKCSSDDIKLDPSKATTEEKYVRVNHH